MPRIVPRIEAGALNRRYFNGPAVDQTFAVEVAGQSPAWLLDDHQNTTHEWYGFFEGSDQVVQHATYSAFGEVVGEDDGTTTNGLDVPVRHAGRFYEAEIEMYYGGGRYYDPISGQYISEAATGFASGDANLYRYAGNSAVNRAEVTSGDTVDDGFSFGRLIGTGFSAIDSVWNGRDADLASLWHENRGLSTGDVGTAFGLGLQTGGKAVVNSFADTGVSFVTLGLYDTPVQVFEVTYDDLARGYNIAYGINRLTSELATGLATGGLAKGLSAGGRAARAASAALAAWDVAGNVVQVGSGVVDVYRTGELNWSSGLSIAGGAAGLSGNAIGAWGKANRVESHRTAAWFDDVARKATRNANSDRLVLGHFSREGTTYQKVAAHYRATYFKLDDWNSVTKGLSQDDIWRINETFLDHQIRLGKKILFSHDPLKARPNSFFEKEVNYLHDLGFNFRRKNQWTWEAVR